MCKSNIDLIKERLNLVAIASELTHLQKRGRLYRGLCPFHQEKTPSFYVNEERGTFRCFGCGVYGSAIDLYAKKNDITFAEAVKQLEREFELRSQHRTFKGEDKPRYCPIKADIFKDLGLHAKSMRTLYVEEPEAYFFILKGKIREKWVSFANLHSRLVGMKLRDDDELLKVALKKKDEYWNYWFQYIVKDQKQSRIQGEIT